MVMPAFLHEEIASDAGFEYSIKIDVYEVVEIFEIGAGNWIAGFIGVGEGVEKGLERALE